MLYCGNYGSGFRASSLTMAASFHEDFAGRALEVRGSPDRVFGLVFAAMSALVALSPLRHGGPIRKTFLVMGIAFAIAAVVRPTILRPLNKAWTQLSLLLSRVLTPITTALLFFVVFVPSGMIARWLRKDPLGLKYAPAQNTYWKRRIPQAAGSMLRQF